MRLLSLALVLGFSSFLTAEEASKLPPSTEDQRVLKDVGLATDARSLLDYLRKQTFAEADPAQMEALIRELGSESFKSRENAYSKLIGLGKGAIVGLKQAEKDADPEIRRRARDLRQRLESKAEPAIQSATAKLIARLQPEGSAEVLLGFLPFAADAGVADDVVRALETVTANAPTPAPVVIKALEDKHVLKRGAAGAALARSAPHRAAVRALLNDPEPLVRVRVGLALVRAKDGTAVSEALPVLIEALQHLPPENLWAVEDVLIRLADQGQVPNVSLGTTEQTRQAAYRGWNEWYAKHKNEIQLARLDSSDTQFGYTLLVSHNMNRFAGVGVIRRAMGEVAEIDHNKKVKWKLPLEDSYPVDAQVIPDRPGEVLIAEYQRARICIRETTNSSNKVLWEKQVGGNPIAVQAFAGGKVLVVLQNRILEIDRDTGDERVLLQRPNHDIFRAKKARTGELIVVTNTGSLIRTDPKGNLLKTFQVPGIPILFGNIDILSNGNVLVPDFQQQRVVEYDTSGTMVNQFATPWPSSAQRLPNGNTLVASQNTQRVVEYNRSGQEVWSYDVDGRVFNARRR